MPIFEKPPIETLALARDRWTPLYLEHGRLEVDDSSVKWIQADGTITRIPVATVSTLILGPGTSCTHAAIKACADCNTPVCWMGEEGLRFYAIGLSCTHDNANARKQANAWSHVQTRNAIARAMFRHRFPDVDVSTKTVKELRGMEGIRVRRAYTELGVKHGVTWKGRNYDKSRWTLADDINRAISAANAALYSLSAAVVLTQGYLPQLGFVHDAGTLPFVYDVADMFKHEITWPAAFGACAQKPTSPETLTLEIFKTRVEESELMKRLPLVINRLFENT